VYFILFIKWKTRNRIKIHLVHLLADKNVYIGDSFVVVLSQKRYFIARDLWYIICLKMQNIII